MTSELTPLRLAWAALATLGAALALARGWPAPRGADWVALAALALWCGVETLVRRIWAAFLTYPAMVLGIGCALPLYLFIRSRRIIG